MSDTSIDVQRVIRDKVGGWLDAIEKEQHGDLTAKVVPFNDLWKWAGYATKGSARRQLEKVIASTEVVNTYVKNPLGGRPTEEILLTVDAAKKFLLKAQTPQGDAACDYFIQCEREWRQCRNAVRDGEIAVRETATGREIDNSAKHKRALDRVESCEATKRTCRVAHENMPDADRAFYVQKNLLFNRSLTTRTPSTIISRLCVLLCHDFLFCERIKSMGFIIQDEIDINNTGVRLANTYCELMRPTLQISGRPDGAYDIYIRGSVYATKQAFHQNKAPLMEITAREVVTEQQLMGNIFQRMRNILKHKFSATGPDD